MRAQVWTHASLARGNSARLLLVLSIEEKNTDFSDTLQIERA